MPVPKEEMEALNKKEKTVAKNKLKEFNAEEEFYFEEMLSKWHDEYYGEVERLERLRARGQNKLTDKEIHKAALEWAGEKPERPKGGYRRKTRRVKKKSRKTHKNARKQ
jgi:hypothetical protein